MIVIKRDLLEEEKIIIVAQFLSYSKKALYHCYSRFVQRYEGIFKDIPIGDLESLEEFHFDEDKDVLDILEITSSSNMEIFFELDSLSSIIKNLSELEKEILYLKYCEDMTDGNIAKKMGLNRVSICKVKNKIIKDIKIQLVDIKNSKK